MADGYRRKNKQWQHLKLNWLIQNVLSLHNVFERNSALSTSNFQKQILIISFMKQYLYMTILNTNLIIGFMKHDLVDSVTLFQQGSQKNITWSHRIVSPFSFLGSGKEVGDVIYDPVPRCLVLHSWKVITVHVTLVLILSRIFLMGLSCDISIMELHIFHNIFLLLLSLRN